MSSTTDALPGATAEPRCAGSSLAAGEELAGSAPADDRWLLVEHPGPWGRKAVAESRLPETVRDHLLGLDGVRVQLIRRPGRSADPGVHVMVAHAGAAGAAVWTATLGSEQDLLGVDPHDPAAGGLTPYDAERAGPLFLVCTNGRRDRCCAEVGRPVVAALAAEWPAGTWETTHLGGHRFAGTLLALPSGVALGRVDAAAAVAAGRELAAGRLPLDLVRGRVGQPPAAQVAEAHLRAALGLSGVDDVRVESVHAGRQEPDEPEEAERPGEPVAVVVATVGPDRHVLEVTTGPGGPVRASCGVDVLTPAVSYQVRSVAPEGCS